MSVHYLIRGNQVISEIDSSGDVVALPLLGGGDVMSLLNQAHAQALMASQAWTAAEALAALGLADLRASMLKAVVISSETAGLDVTGIVGYHLIDVGGYALWQCDGQQVDLLTLHALAWAMNPTETLGLLAVVKIFGSEFYQASVRTAVGMTVQQALDRRDRIATYLEGLGHEDTDDLRAATNEHDQMVGIVTALGYTEQQLWDAMVE